MFVGKTFILKQNINQMKFIDVELYGIGHRREHRVMASMLGHYDFCPHSLFLQYVKKIKVPKTRAMIKGSVAHKKLEKKQKAKSIGKFTFEKAIKKSLAEKAVVRAREVWINGIKLYGITDEILIAPKRKNISLSIIDDKPEKSTVYDGHKLQVMSYCLAISEGGFNFPMTGIIRGRETQTHKWEDDFSNMHKQRVAEVVENIDKILEHKVTAQPKPNPAKCAKCRFSPVCKHSTLKQTKKFSLF